MASEHDARTQAFYDHESDETSPRRRRAAADWGVGEDIFDRMPSRRFKRTDRRAEHQEDGRFERRFSGPARDEWDELRARRSDRADEHERRQVAPRRDDSPQAAAQRAGDARSNAAPRRAGEFDDVPRAADAAPRRGDAGEFGAPRTAGAFDASRGERRHRRPAESWTDDIPAVQVEGERPVDSWLEPEPGKELALAPGESRTVVLEAEPAIEEPPARRTVTITGHPDRMPVPRTPRPPKTAVERLGHSPDRIVGYAVALGFLLVLIAVLTTGH